MFVAVGERLRVARQWGEEFFPEGPHEPFNTSVLPWRSRLDGVCGDPELEVAVEHRLSEVSFGVVELDGGWYTADEGAVRGLDASDGRSQQRGEALGARITAEAISLGDEAGQNHPRVAVEEERDPGAEHLKLSLVEALEPDVCLGVVEEHAVETARARALEVETLLEARHDTFGEPSELDGAQLLQIAGELGIALGVRSFGSHGLPRSLALSLRGGQGLQDVPLEHLVQGGVGGLRHAILQPVPDGPFSNAQLLGSGLHRPDGCVALVLGREALDEVDGCLRNTAVVRVAHRTFSSLANADSAMGDGEEEPGR